MTALMESQKRRLGGDKDVVSSDGGDTYSVYEVGSKLTDNPVNDDGLVGYWKLDEGSGNFADSSGNGNAGTEAGTLSRGQTGKVNKAVGFGTNNYITIADSSSLDITGNLTMSAWVKPVDYTNYRGIFQEYANTDYVYQSYGMFTDQSGIKIIVEGTQLNPSAIPALNEWHHVVGTYDGSNVRLYIDGSLSSSTSKTGSVTSHATDSYIGRFTGRLDFNGSLDDIRIYNRAFSAAEVQALYNANK